MADKTEVNYQELQAIAKKFSSNQEHVQQLLNDTRSRVEGLHGTGWIGRGSEQFFQEMESLILPAMGRLVEALAEASRATTEICAIYTQAEEEAGNTFKAFAE